MQRPHPSCGRCLSLSCLGVADAVARGCRAVVVAEVAAFTVGAAASRVLHHALLHKGKALFVLFPNLPFQRTPVPKCGRLPHRSTQASLAAVLRVRRAAFFLLHSLRLTLSLREAGEVPAVPEQQLRPPHRGWWQNEVAVVRWRGLSTYPSRHGTCLSVSPYGRHARRGSLWCPFPAVASPSWSTEF